MKARENSDACSNDADVETLNVKGDKQDSFNIHKREKRALQEDQTKAEEEQYLWKATSSTRDADQL